MPEPTFRPVSTADRDDLARFLGEHRWPCTATVRWLAGEVFGGWPGVRRIEAQTRRDNLAMRTVLRRCGYVQEAVHRRAWPDQDGTFHDGIGYALLREDWERGTTTPVDWDGG